MGKITRKEAERQLLSRENEAGMFLIRESETCPGTCCNEDKMNQNLLLVAYASSESQDEPAYLHRFTRAFTAHRCKVGMQTKALS